MNSKVIPPKSRLQIFTCPHCGAISSQLWGVISVGGYVPKKANMLGDYLRTCTEWKYRIDEDGTWIASTCENCKKICIWRNEKMIYPDIVTVDEPNEDLPEDIKNDYREAVSILNKSPRGAAAILRLCVQKLCKALGKKGKNLNDDIGELAKDGLPEIVIKAMDILRVTGNNYVHPGKLDPEDDVEIATKLFWLVNIIADRLITNPKELELFYEKTMPQSAKNAVEKRNNRK